MRWRIIQSPFLILFLFIQFFDFSMAYGQHTIPSSFCISPAEKALAVSINNIRIKNGKKPIPLSVSLSYVAKTHVHDLSVNHPDTSICNLSSWSNKGKWTACCYNSYVVNHDGMWKKPQELTSYRYRGYEMAAYMQDGLVPDTLIAIWKSTRESLDMILTEGNWKKKNWECMGIGLNKQYAAVWFGQRPDSKGKPKVCWEKTNNKPEYQVVNHSTNNTPKIPVYYLIIGKYENMKDANEALRRFRKTGFKKAGIIQRDHKIRIYANHYKGFKAALKAKQKLPHTYKDAWILKK